MQRQPIADRTAKKRKAFARGWLAEHVAAASLMLKGHRILAVRFKTRVGEIDLIAARGQRLAFIEVKQRPSREACQSAVSDRTRTRVRRAADAWLATHVDRRDCDVQRRVAVEFLV